MLRTVVWETEDGRWSRGCFAIDNSGNIDYESFAWVSCNHETKESAISAVPEEDKFIVVLFSDNEEQVAEYEEMASKILYNGVADPEVGHQLV